ncbi:MAG: hypothetical protein H0U70_06840 [Tatlockia sp.]|nr:hypothetical protein [Tatlockia sp.]
MLTKAEIDKPLSFYFDIKDEQDLDHCIEFLLTQQIINCALDFTTTNLPTEKIMALQQGLSKQTQLGILSLTAKLPYNGFASWDSQPELAEHLQSSLANLRPSLKSLTLRGLYPRNTIIIVAKLLSSNPNLTYLSVGGQHQDQNYFIMGDEEALVLASALSTNQSLVELDLSFNMISTENAKLIASNLISNRQLKKIDLRGTSGYHLAEEEVLSLIQFNQNFNEIKLDKTTITTSGLVKDIYLKEDFEHILYFLDCSPQLSSLRINFHVDDLIMQEYHDRFIDLLAQMANLRVLELWYLVVPDDILLALNSGLYAQPILDNINEKHPRLEHLTLRRKGGLENIAIESLTKLITSNLTLKSLSMGHATKENYIFSYSSYDVSSKFYQALEKNTHLTQLDVSNNVILSSEQFASCIEGVLKVNKTLKSLKLVCHDSVTNQGVQTMTRALAKNQTLIDFSLNTIKGALTDNVVKILKKNSNLTSLDLTQFLSSDVVQDEQQISVLAQIEQIIERNIIMKLGPFYQTYLLLRSFALPLDLCKFIFNIMIVNFGSEELHTLSTTPSFKQKSYSNPPPVVEEIEDPKLAHFKTIYKAMYEGQSSFLYKHWNPLIDNQNLSEYDIENYIQKNPTSRTATAWKLTKDYVATHDYHSLFKDAHHYSFSHSSIFGFFKQSHLQYDKDIDRQIYFAKAGTRTKTIAGILESGSIKP